MTFSLRQRLGSRDLDTAELTELADAPFAAGDVAALILTPRPRRRDRFARELGA